MVKTWSSETYPVEYGYDDQGRQITLTTWQDFDSASGAAVTTWVYDSQRGWLNRKEYDDGNGTDYTYTPGGRLASRIWARGADTHYAYTPMGELWAVNYIDAENTPDVIYEYTRTGNRKKVVDGQFGASPFGGNAFPSTAPVLATERYAYEYGYRSDLLPDTEKISGLMSFDGTLTRTYQTGSGADSVAGRSAGYEWVANAATNTVTYAYDLAGRLEDVSDGVDTFTYGYHATNGNLLASVSGPVHDVVYEYESGRNAMKAVKNTETVGTNTLVSRYAYTYNELGQRVDRTQTGGAVTSSVDTFAYDDLGQVTSSTNDVYTTQNAWNPSYSYDDIGNRAGTTTDLNGSKDYTANLLNQYTDIGTPAVQPSYDDDGNMTDDGTGWTFTWNGENRLIEATDGTTTLEFEYDYQGRLIKKTENGLSEMYVYDGWNRIATYAGGTLQETNLWGLDLSGSLQGAGGVGSLLKEGGMYPLYDANGNIMQKLDSNGNALMSVTYDPFGNLIDGTLVGDYGFSTKPLIQGVNWYYYGFRYYDPETGRWPNRDPIEEEGGLNLYGLIENDSVNYVDFLGLAKVSYDKTYKDLSITVEVEECEIVLIDQHGYASVVNKFEFPENPTCGSFAGQDTCGNIPTNNKIPSDKRLNVPDNPGDRDRNDSAKNKQTKKAIEDAIKELCKCCKEVKTTRVFINKAGYKRHRKFKDVPDSERIDWLNERMQDRKGTESKTHKCK